MAVTKGHFIHKDHPKGSLWALLSLPVKSPTHGGVAVKLLRVWIGCHLQSIVPPGLSVSQPVAAKQMPFLAWNTNRQESSALRWGHAEPQPRTYVHLVGRCVWGWGGGGWWYFSARANTLGSIYSHYPRKMHRLKGGCKIIWHYAGSSFVWSYY